MSKYTTQLRWICETEIHPPEDVGDTTAFIISHAASPGIVIPFYPIFDNAYAPILNAKIIRHYYTREICEETVALWKLRLQDKLYLIMPYYNKLYETELLKFNPLYDVELNRTHVKQDDGKNDKNKRKLNNDSESSSSTTTSNRNVDYESNKAGAGNSHDDKKTWDLKSDTPQGGVSIFGSEIDPSVEGQAYLSEATRGLDNQVSHNTYAETSDGSNTDRGRVDYENENTIERDESVTSTDVITNVQNYAERVWGKQGTASYSKLLMEFRESLLNIDAMIIEELNDLFFGLWE